MDNCPQLRTLDVSHLQSVITDSLLADVCDKAVELRRLSVHVSPHKQPSTELLTAVVRVCPSLAQLSMTLPTDSVRSDDVVDTVVDAVRQYHGGLCHRHDVISTACHQVQLTFTPLKLLPVLAQCPHYT